MSSALFARQQLYRATAAAAAAGPSSSSRVVAALQTRGYATPKGPPPTNFRTSRKVEWHWDKDTTLDRLGKYFLMTEMARGMYILLEQFFRPPYVPALKSSSARR
jgi:NADH dehydrogenase (ubiquinone) Fe-S protein 8